MHYTLKQPLNTYHLTDFLSYSAYVLPINRLQLFRHYGQKSFPQNVCF